MKIWIGILTGLVTIETLLIGVYCCSELKINTNSAGVFLLILSNIKMNLSKQNYRPIEVEQITGLPRSTFIYWESEFVQLRPRRLSKGFRRYTKENIDTILKIKELLYNKRYTVEAAKNYLKAESYSTTKRVCKNREDAIKMIDTLTKITDNPDAVSILNALGEWIKTT